MVLAELMLKHRKTRGTVIDREWSGKRLRRVSSFCNFRFFNGVTVDISFGEWGSQLNGGHVLSGVYGRRRFNFQWLFITLFIEVLLNKFFLVAW